jgi:hypothetical protein
MASTSRASACADGSRVISSDPIDGRGLQELDCGYGDSNAEAALDRASELVERFGYEGRRVGVEDWATLPEEVDNSLVSA